MKREATRQIDASIYLPTQFGQTIAHGGGMLPTSEPIVHADAQSINVSLTVPRLAYADRPVPTSNGLIFQTDIVRGLYASDGTHWYSLSGGMANIDAYGAIADLRYTTGRATNGSTTITADDAVFTAADVGKLLVLLGAGVAGRPLYGTIASYTSATEVELDTAASTTTSTYTHGIVTTGPTMAFGTDNTAAIQAALDTGAPVYVPTGYYGCTSIRFKTSGAMIGATINGSKLVRLGPGTRGYKDPGGVHAVGVDTRNPFVGLDLEYADDTTQSADNVRLENLTFDCMALGTINPGIQFANAANPLANGSIIRNVKVQRSSSWGFYIATNVVYLYNLWSQAFSNDYHDDESSIIGPNAGGFAVLSSLCVANLLDAEGHLPLGSFLFSAGDGSVFSGLHSEATSDVLGTADGTSGTACLQITNSRVTVNGFSSSAYNQRWGVLISGGDESDPRQFVNLYNVQYHGTPSSDPAPTATRTVTGVMLEDVARALVIPLATTGTTISSPNPTPQLVHEDLSEYIAGEWHNATYYHAGQRRYFRKDLGGYPQTAVQVTTVVKQDIEGAGQVWSPPKMLDGVMRRYGGGATVSDTLPTGPNLADEFLHRPFGSAIRTGVINVNDSFDLLVYNDDATHDITLSGNTGATIEPTTVTIRGGNAAFLRFVWTDNTPGAETYTVYAVSSINDFGDLTIRGHLTVDGGADITGNTTIVGTLSGMSTVTATTFVGALTGNASTATKLLTARTINGVSFDGTANITVTAAAGTLTGTVLNSTVVTSSLTTVGILASPHMTSAVIDSGGLTVTAGGIAVTGNSTIAGTLSGISTLTATTFVGALTGNASTATKLLNARTINGVSFDGTANITVPAAAGTLTGATLAAGVTGSSLTSVGTLTALNVAGNVGIGTTAPGFQLEAVKADDYGIIAGTVYSTTQRSMNYLLRRARGSELSPADVVSGDNIGNVAWRAYVGGMGLNTAIIAGVVDGAPGTRAPARLDFSVGTAAATADAAGVMLSIKSNAVVIGSAAVGSIGKLAVYNATNQATQIATVGQSAGSSYGLSIQAGTNASDYAFNVASQAGATLMLITGAGLTTIYNELIVNSGGLKITSGNLGVGTDPGTNIGLRISSVLTGNTAEFGAFLDPHFSQTTAVTAYGIAVSPVINTPSSGTMALSFVHGIHASTVSAVAGAGTVTLPIAVGFYAATQTLGTTANYGIYVQAQNSTSAINGAAPTSNYGIYIEAASGASSNNYSLWADGLVMCNHQLQAAGFANSPAISAYTTGLAAGTSKGIIITAGTNTTDYGLDVSTQGGTHAFQVRGDGVIIGFTDVYAQAGLNVGSALSAASGSVKATGEFQTNAGGTGVASYVSYTGSENTGTGRSTGVGTIKFADTTARDCVGFLKVMIGTTARYIPLFAAN